MTTPNRDESSAFALMAEGHAARLLALSLSNRALEPRAPAETPSIVELARYARRRAAAVADLSIERYLRRDPEGAARYRRVLASLAIAHSRIAMAASSPEVERRIGDYRLAVIDDYGDEAPLMILSANSAAAWPTMIEAHRGEESVRVSLAAPIDGRIVIVLDPGIAETGTLARLLRDSRCELFLL
jgi:hypothetical protein